jgi:hypothetical protein
VTPSGIEPATEEKRSLKKYFSTKINQDMVKEGVELKTIHPNVS